VPKRPLTVLLDLNVRTSRDMPLHRQLYLGIRGLILDGRLKPGARLPSTRNLANELMVSRTTALNAFEQLIFEGYLEGRVGSGTKVSACIPGDERHLTSSTEPARLPKSRREPKVARRAPLYSLLGAFLMKRTRLPKFRIMNSGVHMLVGGLLLLIATLIGGSKLGDLLATLDIRTMAALAYLVLAGSVLAFSTYVWLLDRVSPTKVSTLLRIRSWQLRWVSHLRESASVRMS